jgi:hypothetical protein
MIIFNRFTAAIAITLTLLLVACAGADKATTELPNAEAIENKSIENKSIENKSIDKKITEKKPIEKTVEPSASAGHDNTFNNGGQVLEIGSYHLELVVLPKTDTTHLDFFLQSGDSHQSIEGASVTGQVEAPDGTQSEVTFQYDAEGKHYYAELPKSAPGDYKLAMLTDIRGEKVNGRFAFSQ